MKAFLRNVCGRMPLTAFVLAVVSAAAQAQTAPVKPSFEGEEGTATVTYIISTTAHMNWFANMVNGEPGYEQNLDANARLTAHVGYDLAGAKAIGGGTEGTEGDKAYNGEFDGGNYTVTATALASNGSYGGFFGHIGANAYIHNLEFAAASTTGLVHAGGLCGYMDRGARIEDCLIDVQTVTSSESSSTGCAGGIVGHCDNPGNERPIRYCYTTITSLVQGGQNDQYRDNICGTHTGDAHPFEYCYYPSENYNPNSAYPSYEKGDGFSYDDITKGRTCYLLNRRQSGGDPWRAYVGGVMGARDVAIYHPYLCNTTKEVSGQSPNYSSTYYAVKDCKVYFGFADEVTSVEDYGNKREFSNNVRYNTYVHGCKPTKIVGKEGSSRVTYYISTPMELVYFINLVNGTLDETSDQWQRQNVWASAKLTRNIQADKIIGLFKAIGGTKAYQGDFDGCGYRIYNSPNKTSIAPNDRYGGLFGRLGEYAHVHNLEIEIYAVSGSQYVGGLCGYMDRGARIDNCYVGVTSVESTWSLTTGYAGGIVGYCDNSDGSQPITNCFSTQTYMLFTGGENGETCAHNICGGHSHATVHPFQNCYYLDEISTERGFTTEDVTGGYTCYLLNGSKNGATTWKHYSITSYPAPHLRGYSSNTTVFKTVYYGYSNSACTGEQSVGLYSSTKDTDESNKRYTKLTSGSPVEPASESGYYMIGTTDEMLWFINKVNGEGGLTRDQNAKAKLTADIVLSDEYSNLTSTKAIGGTSNVAFLGTFDGQGHTITFNNITANDDYGGLFGFIGSTAEIKNLNLKGKKVTGVRYAGGLVGAVGQGWGGSIKDCSVMVDEVAVTAASGEKYAGTLLGYCYESTTYEGTNYVKVQASNCITKAPCLSTETDKLPYCCLLTGMDEINSLGGTVGKVWSKNMSSYSAYALSILQSDDKNQMYYKGGSQFYSDMDIYNYVMNGQIARQNAYSPSYWRQYITDCEALPYLSPADERNKVYATSQTCQDYNLLNTAWSSSSNNPTNSGARGAIKHKLVWDAAHSAYKCQNCNTWRLPITKGKLNSICMPVSGVLYSCASDDGYFEDKDEQTAQLYDFEMIVGHKVYGTPVAHNKIEPGHPYMYVPREGEFVFFVADNDVVDNINTGEHEHGDHINGMYGVLKDDLVSGSANKNVDGTVQTLNYLDVSGGDYVIFYTDGLRFGNDGNKHYLSYGYCYLKTAEVKYKPEAEEVALAPSLVHIGNFLDDFEDEMPTAIEAVEAADAADAADASASTRGLRYNLQGQVVDASYSGIVIVNGKKMFQK